MTHAVHPPRMVWALRPGTRRVPPAAGLSMRDAIHAEWTKLRTAPGTAWLLLAVIAATVTLSAAAAAATRCPTTGCGQDPAKISFTGIYLGQAVVAVVAVLAISSEYSTGMIRTTLAAMPHRLGVLAAKAVVVTGLVLAASTVAMLGSLLAGRLILPRHGFTPAHGFPPLSLGEGPVLRATVGSVLYLALIALLSLGAATAVRDAAVAIGGVLGLLYLFPIVAALVTDRHLQRHLEQLAPMTAGLEIQATTGLRTLPLSPWAGLGVLAAWAAAALLAGGLVVRFRDA
jgi:ABC-2 type transport system permease protein